MLRDQKWDFWKFIDKEVNVDPVEIFPLLITVVAIFPGIIIAFSLSKAVFEILFIKAYDN